MGALCLVVSRTHRTRSVSSESPTYRIYLYSFIHSFVLSFIYSSIHTFIHAYIQSLTPLHWTPLHWTPLHSLTHSLIHSFTHSFIPSFLPFHSIPFHFISLHFISFHFTSFHFISFHFISFHSFIHCLVYLPVYILRLNIIKLGMYHAANTMHPLWRVQEGNVARCCERKVAAFWCQGAP